MCVLWKVFLLFWKCLTCNSKNKYYSHLKKLSPAHILFNGPFQYGKKCYWRFAIYVFIAKVVGVFFPQKIGPEITVSQVKGT